MVDVEAAATFAVLAATLYPAHHLADHVLGQTDHQASEKAKPGWEGWRANLAHVGAYHLVLAALLCVVWAVFALPLSPLGVAVGLAVSAVTHAVLDRRWPVHLIARMTGSAEFVKPSHPLPGAYLIDQSLHLGCLWVAALLMVVIS